MSSKFSLDALPCMQAAMSKWTARCRCRCARRCQNPRASPKHTVLGGSWVVISRVISPLIRDIIIGTPSIACFAVRWSGMRHARHLETQCSIPDRRPLTAFILRTPHQVVRAKQSRQMQACPEPSSRKYLVMNESFLLKGGLLGTDKDWEECSRTIRICLSSRSFHSKRSQNPCHRCGPPGSRDAGTSRAELPSSCLVRPSLIRSAECPPGEPESMGTASWQPCAVVPSTKAIRLFRNTKGIGWCLFRYTWR